MFSDVVSEVRKVQVHVQSCSFLLAEVRKGTGACSVMLFSEVRKVHVHVQ